MILKLEIYKEIITRVINHRGHYRDLEAVISKEYGIPRNTVSSLFANEFKRKMQKNFHKFNSDSKTYKRYQEAVNAKETPSIIMKISDEVDMSYTLVARMVLEKWHEENNCVSEPGKKISDIIKSYMKDPSLMKNPDLAYEIYLCCLYDDQYGNITEVTRHSLGQEYEFYLQEIVKKHNLSFQSEDDLRIYGYDKTPDIKLNIPFAVDGFVINWIESKALFADPEVHKGYIKDQYSSYWNRFGTGLVIYWLGMVDTVIDPSEKRFIVRHDFPTKLTIMNPLSIAAISNEKT